MAFLYLRSMTQVRIHPEWQVALQSAFDQPYFKALTQFVKREYEEQLCFPPASQIFAAFDACPLSQVKVVILGQDPYHGPGQAHGLSFSVPDGQPLPPSLKNIFKELADDLACSLPLKGNLSAWARQGVFLLNATLTVRAHQAGSHQGFGWETFTDAVMQVLAAQPQPMVVLLWGGYARKKARFFYQSQHLVLESGHPSPLSANRGLWFGHRHFSRANAFLQQQGVEPVEWVL